MAARRVVVWLRNDLRLVDSAPFTRAVALAKSSPSTEVLPVYCFDPRHFGTTRRGSPKTGSFRAKFLLESVADLRTRLRAQPLGPM